MKAIFLSLGVAAAALLAGQALAQSGEIGNVGPTTGMMKAPTAEEIAAAREARLQNRAEDARYAVRGEVSSPDMRSAPARYTPEERRQARADRRAATVDAYKSGETHSGEAPY